jgi:HK97 gp10 family phage protein
MFELRCKTELNTAEVLRRVNAAMPARLAKCAALVEGEAKRELNKGATRVGFRDTETGETSRKKSKSEAPQFAMYERSGEFPNKRTGNLQNSIRYAPTPEGTYVVGPTTTAWYGRVMEFGAMIAVTRQMRGFLRWAFGWNVCKPAIYIPARPFMAPALEHTKAQFPEQFRDLPLGGPGA